MIEELKKKESLGRSTDLGKILARFYLDRWRMSAGHAESVASHDPWDGTSGRKIP